MLAEQERPIIIVGCPRSGTTMLQLMLHAHERIAIPPENRFVLTAYQRRREFGDLTVAANRRKLAEYVCAPQGVHFGDLGLDGPATIEEIMAGPPTLGSALAIVLQAYARRFDKPRWGDKRPAYLLNLDVIRKLFPDAQIVNIIRDGRDCVASLKEAPWHRGGVIKAVATWCRGMDEAARAARTFGPDSYYEIYYERLVAEPEAELRALCGYLGERYDPAMTQLEEVANIAVPKRKTWHALTHGEITPERVGSWAQRLDPADLSLCEAVMGDRLRAHGYELTGVPGPTISQWAHYLPEGTRGRMSRAKRVLTSGLGHLRGEADVAARQLPMQINTEDQPVRATDEL